MFAWLLAITAGALVALILYRAPGPAPFARVLAPAGLRAGAVVLLVALLLDAPAGARRELRPVTMLDASASWLRGGDTTAWQEARHRALESARESLFIFGDSLRPAPVGVTPSDANSDIRPVVDRALASGRSVVVFTDGEIPRGSDLVRSLPRGSRIETIPRRPIVDIGLLSLDAPRAAVAGDTVDVRVTIVSGALASPGGTVSLASGERVLVSAPVGPLEPRAQRTIPLRLAVPSAEGAGLLRAVFRGEGDREPRNDTLHAPFDIARAAAAAFVSTSPDFDSREALAVLRGALALPTRGYLRVAPGEWRLEGTLARVEEREVRRILAEAPIAILHGDTALFGPPRALTRGALALVAPPEESGAEWYAVGAPPSPLAGALAGTEWDSLPPLSVSAAVPNGEWVALEVARGRRLDRRPAITGTAEQRRVVVVGASGLWRWRFRGGGPADTFAALWGGIFDWLAAERYDVRAALPAEGIVREGEPVRWRRGATAGDSLVTAVLRRRGGAAGADSVTIRFARGTSVGETEPLPAGLYDVQLPGGRAVLAVNASREWLPAERTLESGQTGSGRALGEAPRLRASAWPFILVVVLLCAEWLLRRRAGMR